MKSLQVLYEEVKASDELKKALAAAVKADKVTDFLKSHGCDSTTEELKEFVAEKVKSDKTLGELSESELEMVAAGDIGIFSDGCNSEGCCDKDR